MSRKLTIKDLALLTKWKDVKRAIKYHYPTDKNQYEDIYLRVLKTRKKKVKPSEFLEVYAGVNSDIYPEGFDFWIKEIIKDEWEKPYYSIHLKEVKEKQDYSISFMSWSYLINLPLMPSTIFHYTFVDILAHFIWEITYYGNEVQMKRTSKKLLDTVKKIKEKTKKDK